MENLDNQGYEVHKGLQTPLSYKGFKGHNIYIAVGVLISGLIISSLFMTLFGNFIAILSLTAIWLGGYLYIKIQQKNGLYKKKRHQGLYIIINKFKIRNHVVWEIKENNSPSNMQE